MDRQQMLDKVAAHLLAQNEKALLGENAGCGYRAIRGGKYLRCAVGCLIPDDYYDECFEGNGIHDLLATYSGARKALEIDYANDPEAGPKVEFLSSLQTIHDHYDPPMWREKLVDLASRANLAVNF